MADKKKRSIFNFYDSQKVGKGVPKEPPPTLNLSYFFKLLYRNITNLGKINLLYVFGNFPFLFGLYAMTGNLNTNSFAPASNMFAPFYGALLHSDVYTPATMALFGVHGVQSTVSLMTPLTYLFFGLTGLIIFTFGMVNTGTTYLIRSIIRNEPIFFWHDFFYAIKRNLRQAIIIGILDCSIILILCYNILLTYFNLGTFVFNIVFYANLLMLFVYFIMRFYIYLMLITFDLKIFKIFKNAFIFSILGGKRNLLAVTGIGLALFMNYMLLGIFMPLGILMPFAILFSLGAFMGAYAAYPKIKEIMMDPYYEEVDINETEEKPVFRDMA
ncbi:MAG: DUF624 domain-containing protein [Eubacteriales bacterium]|nr:DUF624 domain-containing protein [Eubacteriales bacterium]